MSWPAPIEALKAAGCERVYSEAATAPSQAPRRRARSRVTGGTRIMPRMFLPANSGRSRSVSRSKVMRRVGARRRCLRLCARRWVSWLRRVRPRMPQSRRSVLSPRPAAHPQNQHEVSHVCCHSRRGGSRAPLSMSAVSCTDPAGAFPFCSLAHPACIASDAPAASPGPQPGGPWRLGSG